MTTEQEYKYYRDYYQEKYGSAYMSAMKKLSADDSEVYDEKEYLKPEYILTPSEKDALFAYMPEYIDNQRKGR